MSAEALVGAVVEACLEQILLNGSEVAGGSDEPDHVHQLRVGLRRLRTALRELGALSGGIDPGWEPVLAASFRALGERRDRDVLAATFEPTLQALGAPLARLPAPAHAAAEPRAIVREPSFQRVLLRLLALVHLADGEHPSQDADSKAHPRRLLRKRLEALHRKVCRDADGFEGLDEDSQHRVRKRLKRLRYLAELAAPLFDERAMRRYLKVLEPAQDALGRHNDEAVALHEFERATGEEPRAWFAVGWLKGALSASARQGRKALRHVSRSQPFWR